MAALAVGHEHLVLARAQILEPQPQHLTAPQPAEEHGLDHGPVPVPAQHVHERVHLVGERIFGSVRGARMRAGPRDPPRLVAKPRGTGFIVISPHSTR